MAFQLRRGTNAQRSAITPLQGELLYTTDTKTLYVGDGTTAGGTIVSGGGGGATYAISAETTTGGANLRLTGSDASTDNVKLAEGANVTITRTDASTITISSSGTGGGASNLNDLGDVVITGTPLPGQVLKYDSVTSKWINDADSVSSDIFIDDLSDVVITGTPVDGDVLTWNNALALWVNGSPPATYTDQEATDAVGLALNNGIHTGISFNYAPLTQALSFSLDLDPIGTMLQDGTNTGITFSYNSLTNALTSTVAVALADATDVSLGTPIDGHILRYNAGLWSESAETVSLLSDDPSPTLAANLDLDGFSITGIGNIGITGDIEATGDIMTTAGAFVIVTESGEPAPSILDVLNYNTGASSIPLFTIYKSRGTAATPVVVSPGDVVGGMRFIAQGTDVTAQTQLASATIFSLVDPAGTVAGTYAPGAIVFQTRNNAGVLNNALVLNKDGVMKVADNTVLPAAVDEATGAVKYLNIKIGSADYYIPLLEAI